MPARPQSHKNNFLLPAACRSILPECRGRREIKYVCSRKARYVYTVSREIESPVASFRISIREAIRGINNKIKSRSLDISLKSARFFASFSKYDVKISERRVVFLSRFGSRTTEGKPPNSRYS